MRSGNSVVPSPILMLDSARLSMSLANRRRAAVAAGGAIGAVGRAFVIEIVTGAGVDPLWATFLVNAAGSLLLGYLVGRHTGRSRSSPYVIPFAGIGIMGAFTTFSLFSTEVFHLLEGGDVTTALVYVTGSVVVGLVFALTGIRVGRSL